MKSMSSTATLSARAIRTCMRLRGAIPCSQRWTVFSATPIRRASSAWVRPRSERNAAMVRATAPDRSPGSLTLGNPPKRIVAASAYVLNSQRRRGGVQWQVKKEPARVTAGLVARPTEVI